MPALPINNSPHITSLDSKITGDLCGGNFLVDVSPSVFISDGELDVQGASVKITNPVGIIIKQYPTSGFDIYPPMTSVNTTAIPLIAGNYQYGTYTIAVRLTDEDGTEYTVTKSVNICPPDPNNATRKYGCLDMSIKANCRTGEVVFLLNNPPNYKGTTWSSQVNALTVKYPTASGKADLTITLASFSLILYEGQYQVSGTVCALYSYGDEVYFKVNYKVKCEKTVKCIIDECCVFAKLEELNLKVQSDCTQAQKDETASTIVNALWLKQLADLAGNCNGDPSDYISQLEDILGCQCTCNCNEGTPIIGNSSSGGSFIYRGLLTQVETSVPTDVPDLLNRVELTFARTSVGLYTATLSGTSVPSLTDSVFLITGSGSEGASTVDAYFNSTTGLIEFKTAGADGIASDSILLNTAFEIVILNQ